MWKHLSKQLFMMWRKMILWCWCSGPAAAIVLLCT